MALQGIIIHDDGSAEVEMSKSCSLVKNVQRFFVMLQRGIAQVVAQRHEAGSTIGFCHPELSLQQRLEVVGVHPLVSCRVSE